MSRKAALQHGLTWNGFHSFENFIHVVRGITEKVYNFAACSTKFSRMQKLLRILLLCIVAMSALLPRLCECASAEVAIKQQDSLRSSLELKELCDDCGHTKNCCFSKPEIPGGLVSNAENALSVFTLGLFSVWVSTVDFSLSLQPALRRNMLSAIAKWPCSKAYLAKQSLLI